MAYYRRRSSRYKKRSYKRYKKYKSMRKKYSKRKYAMSFIKRTCELASIPINTAGTINYFPRLDDLPNYNEMTAMFDQYKILKVKYRIERGFTGNEFAGTAGPGNTWSTNKFFRIVHDYDGGPFVDAESTFFQFQNMKSYSAIGQKPIQFTLYPKNIGRIALNDQNLAGMANTVIKPQWIDSINANVEHFGIRIWRPQIITGNNAQVHRVIATYYIALRNTV